MLYEYALWILEKQHYDETASNPPDEVQHTTAPKIRPLLRELTDKWQSAGWEIVSHDLLLVRSEFVVSLLVRKPVGSEP